MKICCELCLELCGSCDEKLKTNKEHKEICSLFTRDKNYRLVQLECGCHFHRLCLIDIFKTYQGSKKQFQCFKCEQTLENDIGNIRSFSKTLASNSFFVEYAGEKRKYFLN